MDAYIIKKRVSILYQCAYINNNRACIDLKGAFIAGWLQVSGYKTEGQAPKRFSRARDCSGILFMPPLYGGIKRYKRKARSRPPASAVGRACALFRKIENVPEIPKKLKVLQA
jgi:hypothetical protein